MKTFNNSWMQLHMFLNFGSFVVLLDLLKVFQNLFVHIIMYMTQYLWPICGVLILCSVLQIFSPYYSISVPTNQSNWVTINYDLCLEILLSMMLLLRKQHGNGKWLTLVVIDLKRQQPLKY